jgi:hypothetical protein
MAPMKIIVRTAPMISNRDAVENRLTFAFDERVLSDRLAKKAATIAKTHRITNTKNIAPNADVTLLTLMFEVFGVIPRNDEIVDQLPFQVG